MSIRSFANPAKFMQVTAHFVWPAWITAAVILPAVLIWGVFFTPSADKFGSTVKIIFIHVPSALIAINTYFVMAVACVVGLVLRHHVSFLVAKGAAPIGAVFTIVAIITGAVWGEPMWGRWWVWDARLTAILIMLFFYIGYMAIWAAIDEPEKAADLSAVVCLVGLLFALLSRYAVLFWATLHQDASLSVEAGQRVADVYRTPLYASMAAFYILFIAMLLTRVRTEIRLRRARALRLREVAA